MFTPYCTTTASGHIAWMLAIVYVAGPPGVPATTPFEHVTVLVDQKRPVEPMSQNCQTFGSTAPWPPWYGS